MLVLLFLLLAASDGLISYYVIRRYGIEVELNALIRRFASTLPLGLAIALGIGLPSVGWIAIGKWCPPLLALMVAARAGLLGRQIEAHGISPNTPSIERN